MKCIDYRQSFITTIGRETTGVFENSMRFAVESHCRIIHEKDNKKSDYYQVASCKSERPHARKNLFMVPNYDFMPVFSEDYVLIFRKFAKCTQKEMDHYMVLNHIKNIWGDHDFVLPRTKQFQVDTGIVLWVDLEDSSEFYKESELYRIRLAYVAFNCSDFAEFIIEQPTSINTKEGHEISVWHYSGIKETESKNALFCIGVL